MCKAANKYNGEKSKFSTYAYKCMFTAVMKEKRNQKVKRIIPPDKIFYYECPLSNANSDSDESIYLNYIPNKINIENETIFKLQIDQFKDTLHGNKKKVFQLLYDGYTQNEIANIIGVSKQRISIIRQDLAKKYYMEGDQYE